MLSKQELLKTPEYWQDVVQNEIFRKAKFFMEQHHMNQVQFAEHLGVTKGYVSQILAGECNFSLKKLIEFSLKLGLKPIVSFEPLTAVVQTQNKSVLSYSISDESAYSQIASEPAVVYRKSKPSKKKK